MNKPAMDALKTLHVCNIANVAYGYCKILVQGGCSVDLRCHDMKHLMSQPEWDDLELDPADFPDENDFYNNFADFGDYRRPSWYLSGPLWDLDDASPLHRGTVTSLRKLLPSSIKVKLGPYYYSALRLTEMLCNSPGKEPSHFLVDHHLASSDRCRQLARESSQHGPEWELKETALRSYLPHAHWLARHLTDHEVIFAYVVSPIYAMIHDRLPYVSIEIGTIRDIPFDGTELGKLTALAYRKSDHVIITNPDNRIQAERLNLKSYRFCPHPVDEDVYAPLGAEQPLSRDLHEKYRADFLFLATARQNWLLKGNDKYFKSFSRLVKQGIQAVLLVAGWGQEIERSKQLCRDLELADRVVWLAPMSEGTLVKYYQAADFVLDQFQLGVFGLITPKAMSCGKPVLTSYDPAYHTWCFDEHPPVVACTEEAEIFEAMENLCLHREQKMALGDRSRDWILKHHSKHRVRTILIEAMHIAKENFKRRR